MIEKPSFKHSTKQQQHQSSTQRRNHYEVIAYRYEPLLSATHRRQRAGAKGKCGFRQGHGLLEVQNLRLGHRHIVVYHAATDTQVSITTMGGGPFGGWRFGAGTATVDKVPVGQLIVDIGDTSSRKFVWRGTASATISSKLEKNEKALNTALTKMFQNFPQPQGTQK